MPRVDLESEEGAEAHKRPVEPNYSPPVFIHASDCRSSDLSKSINIRSLCVPVSFLYVGLR